MLYEIYYTTGLKREIAKAKELCKCLSSINAELDNGTEEEAIKAVREFYDADVCKSAEQCVANLHITHIVPVKIEMQEVRPEQANLPASFYRAFPRTRRKVVTPEYYVRTEPFSKFDELEDAIEAEKEFRFYPTEYGYWIAGTKSTEFGPTFDTLEDAEQAVKLIRAAR